MIKYLLCGILKCGNYIHDNTPGYGPIYGWLMLSRGYSNKLDHSFWRERNTKTLTVLEYLISKYRNKKEMIAMNVQI